MPLQRVDRREIVAEGKTCDVDTVFAERDAGRVFPSAAAYKCGIDERGRTGSVGVDFGDKSIIVSGRTVEGGIKCPNRHRKIRLIGMPRNVSIALSVNGNVAASIYRGTVRKSKPAINF